MAETLTSNLPLLAAATGNGSEADNQINTDFNTMPASMFISKYGEDTFNSMLVQSEQATQLALDAQAGARRSVGELAGDTVRNILTGAVTGLTDAAAFTTGLLGADKVSEAIARSSKDIRDFSREHGSYSAQAQERMYNTLQQGVESRLDREYREDLQNGKSELEALSRREAKGFYNTIKNLISTGQAADIGASGLGSILSGGASTALIKGGMKLTAKAVPKLAEKATSAYSKANPVTQKIIDASPWMASMGLQEGGSQYSQLLLEGLDTPTEDLYANSPGFVRAVKEYMEQGIPKEKAEEFARRDMAFAAAKEAGIETGIAAGIANYMTAGLARPFARLGKTTGKYMSEALSEPVEEALSEGAGTLATNLSTQRYLDQRQELTEGLGQSMAEGAVGGLGIVATRAASPTTIRDAAVGAINAYDTAKEKYTDYQNSPDKLYKRIDNISKQSDFIKSHLDDTNNKENTLTVSENLKSLTDTVLKEDTYSTAMKENDTSMPAVKNAMDLLDKIDSSSDAVTATTTTAETAREQNRIKNIEKSISNTLAGLKPHIAKNLGTKVQEQRQNYTEDTVLTTPQLELEGAYFATQNQVNSKKAQKEFNSLPLSIKTQLLNAKFSNATSLQSRFEDFTSSLSSSADSKTVDSMVTEASKAVDAHEASMRDIATLNEQRTTEEGFKSIQDSYSTPKEDIAFSAPATETAPGIKIQKNTSFLREVSLEDLQKLEELRSKQVSPDTIIATTKDNKSFVIKGDKAYQASSDIAGLIANNPENFSTAQDQMAKLNANPFYAINLDLDNGKTAQYQSEAGVLEVYPDAQATEPSAVYEPSEEQRQILESKETSYEQKAKVLQELLKDEKISRNYIDLSPKTVEEQGMYYDSSSGTTVPLASEEVEKSFVSKVPQAFNKVFRAVKRGFHLLASDSPSKTLTDMLKDPEQMLKILQQNHATNASSIYNSLYTVNGKLNTSIRENAPYETNSSLAQQIVSLLGRNNQINKTIREAIRNRLLEAKVKMPPEIKDILFSINNGTETSYVGEENTLQEKFVDLLTVSAIQWLALMRAYRHNMNAEELARLGFDLDQQAEDFSTSEGVISTNALQNLSTTIRKMMGVGIRSSATQNEVSNTLGAMSVYVAEALQDTPYLQTQTLNVVDNTGETVPLVQYVVSKDLGRMFNNKADIILRIVDPTLRNAWHTSPQSVRLTMNKSTVPLTKALRKAVERLNNSKAVFNTYFAGMLHALGGEDGLTEILGENVSDRFSQIGKNKISKEGRAISRSQAFQFLKEFVISNPDADYSEQGVYFDHAVISNGRIMMLGSATPQNNKIMRELLSYINAKSVDLSEGSHLRPLWKTAIAQRFGEKVSRMPLEDYEDSVDKAISFLEKTATEGGQYSALFDTFLSQEMSAWKQDPKLEQTAETRKQFIKFKEDFRKNTDWKVESFEEMNALLEMVRFVRTSDADKKNFTSYTYIENDGISDGPSNVNAVFSLAVSAFSSEYFENLAKTGTYVGVKTTAQQALRPLSEEEKKNSDTEKLLQVAGKDIHNEVAREKLPHMIMERIVALQREGGKDAENALKALKATLNLFKAVGWLRAVNDADNESLSIDDIFDNASVDQTPFVFDREISKHLTTVTVYGSGAKGASRQILRFALAKLYEDMSHKLETIKGNESTPDYKRIESFLEKTRGITYVLDTETTGLNVQTDDVVQISIRELDNGRPTGKKPLSIWLKTDKPILKEFSDGRPNPIYEAYQKATFTDKTEAFEIIKKYVGKKPIIGHNIQAFDAQILKNQGLDLSSNKLLDTLALSQSLNNLTSNSLDDLRPYLTQLDASLSGNGASHNADVDTQVNAALVRQLRDKADTYLQEAKATTNAISATSTGTFNGLTLSEVMGSLEDLVKLNNSFGTYSFNPSGSTQGYLDSVVKNFPTAEELMSEEWREYRNGRVYSELDKDKISICNFEVTAKGIEKIASNMEHVFGEVALAAVKDSIGIQAMEGSKIPAAVTGILNFLPMSLQRWFLKRDKGKDLTQTEIYNNNQKLQEVSPEFTFKSGVRVNIRHSVYDSTSPATFVSDRGTQYVPSQEIITGVQVAGGAIVVQGMGDASMVVELMDILKEGVVLGEIYDGMNSSIDMAEEINERAAEASLKASRQRVIKSLLTRVERVGKVLRENKEYGVMADSNTDAVIIALSRIVSGKFIDGTNDPYYSEENDPEHKKLKNLRKQFLSYLEEAHIPTWEPNLVKSIKDRAERARNKDSTGGIVREASLHQQLRNFFVRLQAQELNYEINQRALEKIPVTAHHMAGTEAAYIRGEPIDASEALEFLKEVNKSKASDVKYKTFYEFLSAWANTLAEEEAPKIFSKNKVSQEVIDEYYRITQRDKANSGVRVLTSQEEADAIKNKFNKEVKPFNFNNNNEFSKRQLKRDVLKDVFRHVGKKSTKSQILENIYSRISELLPENLQIEIVGSRSVLPKEVQKHFSTKASGVYYVENGIPHIVIIDQGLKLNPFDNRNAEILVHEGIHVALSAAITNFYKNPEKLTATQRKAIQNLEDLLKDFMRSNVWNEPNAPIQVQKLRELLSTIKDPAERLDESLAYILSNAKLMEELADYHLKNRIARTHSKKLTNMLKDLVNKARAVWKSLVRIVLGSPLDSALDSMKDAIMYKTLDNTTLEFLELYGANTMVLLKDVWNQKEYNNKDLESISGTTRSMLNDFTAVFDARSEKGHLNSLRDAIKDRWLRKTTYKIAVKLGNKLLFSNRGRKALENIDKVASEKARQEFINIQNYEESFANYLRPFVGKDVSDAVAKNLITFLRNDTLTSEQRDTLTYLYRSLTKNLKPDFLIQDRNKATKEEIARSEELYNLIKGTSNLWEEGTIGRTEILNPKAERICILYALAMSSSEINSALGKFSIERVKYKKKLTNPLKVMEDITQEFLAADAAEKGNNRSVGEVASLALQEGVELSRPASDRTRDKIVKFFGNLDAAMVDGIASALSVTSNAKGSLMQQLGAYSKNFSVFMFNAMGEALRSKANALSTKYHRTWIAELVRNLYGRIPSVTPFQDAFKELRGFLDKNRQQNLKDYPELLKKEFKNTKITHLVSKFLYRTVATTDLAVFSVEDAKDLILHPQKINQRIFETEALIQNAYSDNAQSYFQKAQQLSNYLMGKAPAGRCLLTNAFAIAYDAGNGASLQMVSKDTIIAIDELITLYNLRNMSEGDISQLQTLFKTDEKAMSTLIENIRSLHSAEEGRLRNMEDKSYLLNHIKGWLPKGNLPGGHFAYVPESRVKEFISKGYINKGRYEGSNLDKEPIYAMYCNYPIDAEYQEGLMQTINRTGLGYRLDAKSRDEAQGTRINDPKIVKVIRENYDSESGQNGLIPSFNTVGQIVSFERSIDPRHREFINKDLDIFSALAQYKERQSREEYMKNQNKHTIELCYEDFKNASLEEKKTQFIDILHTNNKMLREGYDKLSWEDKKYIKDLFGDHFYIRPDNISIVLGHSRMTVTDLWNHKSPLPEFLENAISTGFDLVLGKRARYKVGQAERFLMSVVTFARDTIIIRSGFVAAFNIIANTLMLNYALGMPFKDIARYYKQAFGQTMKYNKLVREFRELEFKRNSTNDVQLKKYFQEQMNDIKLDIENSSIYRLLKEGEYSTISAEGATLDSPEIWKGQIDAWIDNKIGDSEGKQKAKEVLKNFLMTKGSTSYQTMAEMVNLGDWIAKVAGYNYLTSHERGKKVMLHEHARNLISMLFVDYDQPIGREQEWLNRIGVTWFFTYKWRMIPAAIFTMMANPSRTILTTMAQGLLPGVPNFGTPLTENLISKFFSGNLDFSLWWDTIWRGLTLHPLNLITGVGR